MASESYIVLHIFPKKIHLAIRSRILKLLSVLFLLTQNPSFYAQSGAPNDLTQDSLHFETFTIPGYPTVHTHCLFQDSKGFMWFGTDDGLIRYDGYEIVHFQYDPDDPHSLQEVLIGDKGIVGIMEDHEGYLWVGSISGVLNRYDSRTGQFESFQHDPEDTTTISGIFTAAIHEDANRTLWVGSNTGLHRLDQQKMQFKHYELELISGDVPLGFVTSITDEEGKILWIATTNGLFKMDLKTERLEHFTHHPDDSTSLGSNHIISSHLDKTNRLWLGTAEHLQLYDPNTNSFITYLEAPSIQIFQEDRSGFLWMGTSTENGLLQFDPATGRSTSIRNSPDLTGSPTFLPFLQDHTGLIWIIDFGTPSQFQRAYPYQQNRVQIYYVKELGEGYSKDVREDSQGRIWLIKSRINWLDPKSNRFRAFEFPDGKADKNFIVHQTHFDSLDRIWMANSEELYVFDTKTLRLDHYPYPFQNGRGHLNDLAEYQGKIWLANSDEGVLAFDIKTGQYKVILSRPKTHNPFHPNGSHEIYQDSKGNMWIGSNNGLNLYDPVTETVQNFKPYPDGGASDNTFTGLLANSISDIVEDQTGLLWLQQRDQLLSFDPQSKSFRQYTPNPNDPTAFSGSTQWMEIFKDSKNNIWICTPKGLNKYIPEKDIFRVYKEKDGLPNSYANDIDEDDKGFLWVTTDEGLSRFDPEQEQFYHFTELDGFPLGMLDFTLKSARTGNFYLTDWENKLVIFHPDSLEIEASPAPIHFTALIRYVDGQPVPVKSITGRKEIEFSYQDKMLEFRFATLDYRPYVKKYYAYQLEGLNDDWIYLGTKRELSLMGLAPGNYTLRVKGSNHRGIWNEEGASLKITILPPWWQSWWAYALYALLGITAVGAFIRYRTRQQEQKLIAQQEQIVAQEKQLQQERQLSEQLKKVDQLKDQFLANTSHELRTPLNGIIGLAESLKDGIGGPQSPTSVENLNMITASGQRLASLVNDILDFFAKEFVEATVAFQEVLKIHPEDATAQLFFNKAGHYITAGVEADWTGVEVMMEK